MPITTSCSHHPYYLLPIMALSVWIVSVIGCDQTPSRTPVRSLTTLGSQFAYSVQSPLKGDDRTPVFTPRITKPSAKPNRPAVRQAGMLLRQAADLLDTNERMAVRLIRQAIALLKREGISGIDAPDYDRVSLPMARLLQRNRGQS